MSIMVRDRYVPTEKSTAPPRDETYSRTDEEAFRWLSGLLSSGYTVREVTASDGKATVVAQELGRNTGSLFEFTFSGPLAEMKSCLVAAYYWYDAHCVEPPADYPFSKPEHRLQVLDTIVKTLPLRDAVGALLRSVGYEPPTLDGLYDVRGCAPSWVAVMVYAGITDPETLAEGVKMPFAKLFEICEYVRVCGLTFAQGQAELS